MDKDPIIKAKELIKVLRYFQTIKKVTLPKGMKCPFDIEDDELGHYELSEATSGLGYIRWDCPFCGKHFEE